MTTTIPSSNGNDSPIDYYYGQCWLAAHNAWNTALSPADNQQFSITELLDYGVRGFALDIWGDKGHLHLQHGDDNPASAIDWDIIREELKAWMVKNPTEIVTLFFESHLYGPHTGTASGNTPLEELNRSLSQIPSYVHGRANQEKALLHTKIADLITQNKRLFAFLEEEPVQSKQTLFPVMRDLFAENHYGDDSVDVHSWIRIREGSNYNKTLTFMNHFRDSPAIKGHNVNFLFKHTRDFMFNFGGRRPMFISLDNIDASQKGHGVINLLKMIPTDRYTISPFSFTDIEKDNWNDVDMYLDTSKVTDFKVESADRKGITKITPLYYTVESKEPAVAEVELLHEKGYGIVNMRVRKESDTNWGNWLTSYGTPGGNNITSKIHKANEYFVGLCCRTEGDYGVTDVAFASPL